MFYSINTNLTFLKLTGWKVLAVRS